jgi:nucleotidyltransferase/DNA polymerase involved in DNA repair
MIRSEKAWPRIVAHADMHAFYAAIEQLDDPMLRGKPVLVGPPSDRGVVLTACPFRKLYPRVAMVKSA